MFDRCHQEMVQIIERNDREFSAFRNSIADLEKKKLQLEEKMKELTLGGKYSAGAVGGGGGEGGVGEESRDVEERLELKWILDFCDIVRDPTKLRHGNERERERDRQTECVTDRRTDG